MAPLRPEDHTERARDRAEVAAPFGVVVSHLTMAAVVWLAAGVVAWLALRTWTGQQLDEWALQEATAVVGPGPLRLISRALDLLPIAAALLGAAAIVTIGVRTRRIAAVAIVLGLACFALASVQVLKLVVLSKPDLGIQEATINSFPSGHASLAAVVSLVWVLAVPISARGWTAVLGAVATIAIGVATVLTGWHRPADAVAAILITAGWGAIAALALRATLGRARLRGPRTPRVAKGGLGLFALATAIALGMTQLSTEDTSIALAAGLLAIGATALLTFAGIVAISRHP